MQVRDQGGEASFVEQRPRQVDDHGPVYEEGGRAPDQGVQFGEPVGDGQLRREHEAHEGAAADADRGARAGFGGHECCRGHGR